MSEKIKSIKVLKGTINIPGDKSISHRSVMLGGLADFPVKVTNFLPSADCLSTASCMRSLGVSVKRLGPTELVVKGNGLRGLTEPADVLDAGNSGTTIRLLTGLLAGQPFFSVFTGDPSLRRRPMGRVITPLAKMGADVRGRGNSRYAPLAIIPTGGIKGIEYVMPMASAQVKSAILLAGLFADGETSVTEPYLSRDHTERMLEAFGVKVSREHLTVKVTPPKTLTAPEHIDVPGDISSAAFWLVAATIIPGSKVTLKNVGVNPTRTGIIDCLISMGANITLVNQRLAGEEPVADLVVEAAELSGVTLEAEIIPRLIDEIPVLAVAALFAKGQTIIRGAEELRVKESDRLTTITKELTKLGAKIMETPDGLIIDGPQQLAAANCEAHDDHRIAMAVAVAGMASSGIEIEGAECVAISYPDFFNEINTLRQE
ncbi:MAG: aroA1 [Firmicutes bacterium]|nr:aroA1 [Bacillota bacterium]